MCPQMRHGQTEIRWHLELTTASYWPPDQRPRSIQAHCLHRFYSQPVGTGTPLLHVQEAATETLETYWYPSTIAAAISL